ncbi:MAG: hypothetical protein ABGX20_02340 [Bacillus sp. (in: firmicutes)]
MARGLWTESVEKRVTLSEDKRTSDRVGGKRGNIVKRLILSCQSGIMAKVMAITCRQAGGRFEREGTSLK